MELDTPCLLWDRAVSSTGYGSVWVNGKSISAHVAAFIDAYGPVPAGQRVCHRCDVRLCVEPTHLFAGTQKDNMHDMIEKGRAWFQTDEVRSHCKNGHTREGNTYIHPQGFIQCRICQRAYKQAYRDRKKAELNE